MIDFQQFISDTDREFNEGVPMLLELREERWFKKFIHIRLRALLEEVVGEIESMRVGWKIEEGIVGEMTKIEQKGYENALTDLASHLREEISKITK